jgi:hypothetical protein
MDSVTRCLIAVPSGRAPLSVETGNESSVTA